MLEQIREDGFVVFLVCSRGISQRRNGVIHCDDGTGLFGFLDLVEMFEYRLGIRFGNFGESRHPAPNETIVFTFQAFYKVFGIVGNQFWFDNSNFIQNLDAIGLDVLVFIPQVFRDFADALLVFLCS